MNLKIPLLFVVALLAVYCGAKLYKGTPFSPADQGTRYDLRQFAKSGEQCPCGTVAPEHAPFPLLRKCLYDGRIDDFLEHRAIDAGELFPNECTLSGKASAEIYLEDSENGFL